MSKLITHKSTCDYGDYSIEIELKEDISIRKSMVKHFGRNKGSIYFTTELVIMPKLDHIKMFNKGKWDSGSSSFWKSQFGLRTIEPLYNAREMLFDLINKITPKYNNDICILIYGSDKRRNKVYTRALKDEGFKWGDVADKGSWLFKWYSRRDNVYPKIKY